MMPDGQTENQRNQEYSAELDTDRTVEPLRSQAYSSMNDSRMQSCPDKGSQNSGTASLPELALTESKSIQGDSSNKSTDYAKQLAESKEPQQRTFKNEKGETVTEFTNDPDHRTKETQVQDRDPDFSNGGPKILETEYKNHPTGKVKESHYAAKDVTEYYNGTKVSDYVLGDSRVPEPGLKRVTESIRGNYKEKEYEISEAAKNGASVEKVTDIQFKNRSDGKVAYERFSDGQSITRYQNGIMEIRDSNGNAGFYDKNGRRVK